MGCRLPAAGYLFKLTQVVGGGLVDIVIQPVGEQQVGVGPPARRRRGLGIVVGKVVARDGDVQTLSHVATVLGGEGAGIVFQVAGNEDLSSPVSRNSADPRL